MILMFYMVLKNFYDSHPVRIITYLAPDGRGNYKFQTWAIPSTSVSVVVTTKYFADIWAFELGKHLFSKLNINIEIFFGFFWRLQKPWNVLKNDFVFGTFFQFLIYGNEEFKRIDIPFLLFIEKRNCLWFDDIHTRISNQYI